MERKEFKKWIIEIKEKTPNFLEKMKGNKRKGFFRYSLSGDIFGENIKWGLGNGVFALKIYYTLGIKPENLDDIVGFIQSFQKKNGVFYDPVVMILSTPLRILYSLKHFDFNNLLNQQTIRAETRQSISALDLFNKKPKYDYLDFPKIEQDIEKYLNSLDWTNPWGAGSHFSHLLFFLSHTDLENKLELIDYSIDWINNLQKEDDGCWYKGNPPLQLKVNGAMKVITGLKVATSIGGYNSGKLYFDYAEQLIDTGLVAINDSHACDNFNLTYILKYANEVVNGKYRYDEIEDFMKNRLDIYNNFYFPKYGAFSFLPKKANMVYYGAPISKGKTEPDIHGTSLFLWGLSVIADFFGIDKSCGIQEFVS